MAKRWMKIRINLETLSPLHIGGFKDPFSDIDNPVVMINNEPQIPGSTLKGAWRCSIEDFLIAGNLPDTIPCIPNNRPSQDEINLIKQGKYKGNCLTPRSDGFICPACYIHGAPSMRGFARTPFLTLVPGQLDPVTEVFELRFDRALDLGGGSAGGTGGNRKVSMVRNGVKFQGILEILLEDTIKGWKLGSSRKKGGNSLDKWLNNGWNNNPKKIIEDFVVKRLEGIEKLGGYQSKGYGHVRIQLSDPDGNSNLDDYITEQIGNAFPTN